MHRGALFGGIQPGTKSGEDAAGWNVFRSIEGWKKGEKSGKNYFFLEYMIGVERLNIKVLGKEGWTYGEHDVNTVNTHFYMKLLVFDVFWFVWMRYRNGVFDSEKLVFSSGACHTHTQTLNVWCIYLRFPPKLPKCR